MRGVRAWFDKGCCGLCRVTVSTCQGWQWIREQRKWEDDREKRCQYEGVLVSAMVTMMELGNGEGAKRVGGLGWASGEWRLSRWWWRL